MTVLRVKSMKVDEGRGFHATVGATAVVRGQLVKYSAGAIVTLAADDKQLDALVCISDGAALGDVIVIPLVHVDALQMAYTGSAPTVGAAYGISDGLTLDQAETTAKLLVVISVDTDDTTCQVRAYLLTS